MRFTNSLWAQHLGWTFKRHWLVQGKRIPRDTGAAAELEKCGKLVKSFDLVESQKKSIHERLHAFEKEKDTHDRLQATPGYLFGNNNVLVEGLPQALLLTKTIEISDLPESLQQSVNNIQFTALQERGIKMAILGSNVFSADQVKLPKKRSHLRPEYNLPREYSIPKERKITLLLNKLLTECEKYAGPNITSQRRLVNNVNFNVTVLKNETLLQFGIDAQKMITSSRPIKPIKGKYDGELPDLHPLKCTISLPKHSIYANETSYPFSTNLGCSHPHTIFLQFDNEKVKNIHDVEVTNSQFQSRNMLKAFSVAAARARQLYGNTAVDFSNPIVVQSIQTDGRTFHFGVFQLNTLRLDDSEGVKNYWFNTCNQDLFHTCQYVTGKPVLEDFNRDVLRYLYAFYCNS
uniref:Large ribosomal subunit protein mL37 n=1 Tax=Ceratitis capitata TaxID=7213 RepID=W8CD51_CERCA